MTDWTRSETYEENQWSTVPLTPKVISSRLRRTEWSSVLNAALIPYTIIVSYVINILLSLEVVQFSSYDLAMASLPEIFDEIWNIQMQISSCNLHD